VTQLIGVFCGSNAGRGDGFLEDARQLGSGLADKGFGLVYGGGRVGLMGAVADAVLASGAEVIGVITEHLVGAEVAHDGVTRLEVVPTMHERKARMAELAIGFIVLPGGFGTLDESLELLTWNQLGLLAKPVVFFDTGNYFERLFEFFQDAVNAQFIRADHAHLARWAATVDEALDLATAPPPVVRDKWIDRRAR
jgi:uncharacterized protein (TIGR00730 family)